MALKNTVYLDYNATTPVSPEVVEAMLPYFTEKFGNSGSDHVFGWDAEEAVEVSRTQLAKLLHCRSTELFFTSGATEAANLVINGFCLANRKKGNHLITSKTEHKAVLDTMKSLEAKGFEVTYLEVDSEGNIDLQDLERAIRDETIMVSLMLANNETGLINPIEEISAITHSKGTVLLSDITQAVGKIPLDLQKLGIDLAIFSAHKLYGPKGVGAFYINKRNKIELDPFLFGGGQEKGLRPGTLNVPAIVGFGKAAEIASSRLSSEHKRLQELRDRLEELLEAIEGIKFNSKNSNRLPNTSNFSFSNIDGSRFLRKLNTLAVSRGSACSANTLQPSHVLKAMGLNDELALASLRISIGKDTSLSEIEFAAEEIKKTVEELKTAEV